MDIYEWDINCKGCCPEVLPHTYKEAYIVILLRTILFRIIYPGTGELDLDPEGLIYTQKD